LEGAKQLEDEILDADARTPELPGPALTDA
jgi:hypothetical protein